MADWSQLPPELLLLIGKRLEARFDVLRFQSVCSSWRSSVPPKVDPFLLPMYLPSAYRYCGDDYRICVSRNTCYLIRLSHCDQTQALLAGSLKSEMEPTASKCSSWILFQIIRRNHLR
ncbi:hypothetical protein V6N12_006499 [Hibiscus sabdariffa]|uniref:F-box domain-containing protein n=1 Tax=Hibiscus sabdariffa TaxID=183260 RepID=A0ABR2EYZ7_9ROSI